MSAKFTIPQQGWKSFFPNENFLSHINNSIRLDGRAFNKFRPIHIKSSVLNSTQKTMILFSAEVQIGGTIVLLTIRPMIGQSIESSEDEINSNFMKNLQQLNSNESKNRRRGNKGDVTCNVLIGHLQGTANVNSNSSANNSTSLALLANDVQYAIETLYNKGEVFSLEELQVQPGSSWVFRLCMDITVISNDGSVVDASILASLIALNDLTLPEVTFETPNNMEHDDSILNTKNIRPSILMHGNYRKLQTLLPIIKPITIGIIFTKDIITYATNSNIVNNVSNMRFLVDMSSEEEAFVDASLTCVISRSIEDSTMRMHLVHMGAKSPIPHDVLKVALSACQEYAFQR